MTTTVDGNSGGTAVTTTTQPTLQGQVLQVVRYSSGSTSSMTFKVRAGSNQAGTMTFNGNYSARIFGGVAASSITEVVP